MTNIRISKFSKKMTAITVRIFTDVCRNVHVHIRAIVANIFQVLEKKNVESLIFSLDPREFSREWN